MFCIGGVFSRADLEWKWRLIKECIGADHQHQVELLLAGLERALADVSGQLAGVQRALRAPTAVGPHAQRLHHKYYVRPAPTNTRLATAK